MRKVFLTHTGAIDTSAAATAVVRASPLVARGTTPALAAHALASAIPAA